MFEYHLRAFYLPILFLALLASFPASSPAEVLRSMRYTPRPPEEARAWQKNLRTEFYELLKLEDLVQSGHRVAFASAVITATTREGYLFQEIGFQTTANRRIHAILTLPSDSTARHPAVVCIHGHGGDRFSTYQEGIYNAFAAELAKRGVVTVAVDVGQHEVYEEGRTLMGERLWDLIRSVDLLVAMPEVDPSRIGCAGLSLGGEMAMWLGAMDERISAVASSGFLTRMDQMEEGHCPCWKFEGLRGLADWADIYSLIAPRALMCQNGLQEPATDFTVPLAREAMEEIKLIYKDLGAEDRVSLAVHEGAHVIDLPTLIAFFEKYLKI